MRILFLWLASQLVSSDLNLKTGFQTRNPSLAILLPNYTPYHVSDGKGRLLLQHNNCSNGFVTLTLKLRWISQAQFAGYYAAQERGYYRDLCLSVDIDDTDTEKNSGDNFAVQIPWLLQFLQLVNRGQDFVHVSQVFQRGGWRYMGLPTVNAGSSNQVRNFGDMSGGVKIAVPVLDLEDHIVSLISKYNRSFCGANDFHTHEYIPCRGGEDIHFLTYGFDVSRIAETGASFVMGMTYNELGRLLLQTEGGRFKYTINDPGAANNILIYDPARVDGLLLPEDGLMAPRALTEGRFRETNVLARFLEASFRGWIYCRDNEEACVSLFAPPGGNTNQQEYRTSQAWQMHEVNRVVWPAPHGVGLLNETLLSETVEVGVSLGYLNASSEVSRRSGPRETHPLPRWTAYSGARCRPSRRRSRTSGTTSTPRSRWRLRRG
uniref:Myristoyl transferase n=1 Tax=Tetraselmis sp. GSL018 TaxID=582737 RepID=A0A061S8H9_9CHLO